MLRSTTNNKRDAS